MKSTLRSRLLQTSLLIGASAIAAPAFAQATAQDPSANALAAPQEAVDQTEANESEVVVTGTLIRNPNLTSSTPVAVIGENEITKRAPNTVEELLRQLPGVSPGVGSQVNNGSNGTNSVDLRGLGVQRNLVLLDGKRIVPTLDNGAVDLNVIPIALLQRVDVLTGGASTTYGADAVSGVVNFITRKDFNGLDLRASYKIPQRGEGAGYRADLTVGSNFADDRGNAVLSFGYTKVKPLYQTRPFALFGISSTTGVASGASATSVPSAIAFDNGAFLQVNPAGTALIPQYQGFNFNPYNIFQTPLERKSAFGALNYEVADGVEVYARGLFSQSTIRSIIAPSGIFGLGFTIPGNNPFLNATIRDQLCANNGLPTGAACAANPAIPLPGVYRRLVELGPRISNYENNIYDARVGVKADLSEAISLDVGASYGRSEQTQTQSGYVINTRIQQSLNATNTTTCTVNTNGCVPVNLFGAAGSITPAQVAYLQGQSTIKINTELKQVHALFSGDITQFSSASQPVSFAVGGEYRKYTYERIPDAFAADPSALGGAGGAVLPFVGGYDVKEAYGELIAPLISDRPFFNELTAEAGVRYSSYNVDAPGSPSFNTTTYKGGLTWEPVDDFRLRGNYQRAVRAPNIGELFSPVVTGLVNLTIDPCAGTAPNANATLRAVCLAQGAPTGTIGTIPQPSAGQANATGGGNVNLDPEKADTYTLGAVFTPRAYVPGLSFSVDYYNIKIKNAITAATPGDVIAACFGSLSATSAACTTIRRNPANGGLSGPPSTTFGLPLPTTNNGRLKTDGVDLTVNYKHTFGEFGLDLGFLGNYTRSLKFQASPTSVNRDCVGFYSANCGPSLGQIQPKYSWQQRTGFSFGGASLSLLWRHIGKVAYEGTASDFAARGFTADVGTFGQPGFVRGTRFLYFSGQAGRAATITNGAGGASGLAGRSGDFNRISARDYFDLTLQFDVTKRFQLTLGVQNLLDKDPPVVGGQAGSTTANSGNTFPSTYDPIGRAYSASVRVNF